jgi:DNA-binding response OmpR family regulator
MDAPEIIFYGNSAVDCDTRSVVVGGRRQYLAPKEYTVFKLMLDLMGRPLHVDDKRSVAVYLCRVRKKLRAIDSNITIRAVRDRGYCLVVE